MIRLAASAFLLAAGCLFLGCGFDLLARAEDFENSKGVALVAVSMAVNGGLWVIASGVAATLRPKGAKGAA